MRTLSSTGVPSLPQRRAAEPRERPHTQHRRWDCGNCIGGEEVAATLKPPVSYDMGSFFYVWLRYKKKMSERRDDRKP